MVKFKCCKLDVTTDEQIEMHGLISKKSIVFENDDGFLLRPSAPNVRALRKQETLFSEGDDGGQYFEVLEGIVCSFRVLNDGRRQILSFSYPGDLVGIGHEMEYGFSCEAICDAKVRCISRMALQRSIDTHPDIARKMLKIVSLELARMQDRFALVYRRRATEKMASFLLALAHRSDQQENDQVTFELQISRIDIADFLDMTHETVSRLFSAFRKIGVIDMSDANIVHVLDMTRLEKISGGS